VTLVLCSSVYAQREPDIVVKNRYLNYDYAYSVRVPNGLTGSRSPSPFPNHGFGIQLSDEPKASISVDGSYNAAEWRSFDDAIKAHKGFFKHEVGSEVKVVARAPAVLGKLRAVRFTMTSNNREVREVLLAFRKAPGEDGIVYEIVLTTPTFRYAKDKHVLGELQRTFRLKSLPK